MRRLIIAESSDQISGALKKALQGGYDVYTCSHSKDLHDLLQTLRPEALIINLSLTDMGGIAALSCCRYRPPVVLALTYVVTQDILKEAQAAGIRNVLLLPCTERLIIERLDNLINSTCP